MQAPHQKSTTSPPCMRLQLKLYGTLESGRKKKEEEEVGEEKEEEEEEEEEQVERV